MADRRRHERVSMVMAAAWCVFVLGMLVIGLVLWLWSGG